MTVWFLLCFAFARKPVIWTEPCASIGLQSTLGERGAGHPDAGRPFSPLEKEMATSSSVLAWRIPWTEEPGGHRVAHD